MIVGANGERIDDREALHNFEGLQARGHAGDAGRALRNGKPLQLTAALREQPRVGARARRWIRAWPARPSPSCPSDCARLALDGVLVEKVARGSRAAPNGLQGGDVVIAANSGRFDDLPGFRLSFPTSAPKRARPAFRNWCCASCAATRRATC